MIKRGAADVMIAGGSEAAVCKLGIAGFCAARSLSTSYNDSPHEASRPWDIDRDGFVMGEGAGIVVLEEMEFAKKRGANIFAELNVFDVIRILKLSFFFSIFSIIGTILSNSPTLDTWNHIKLFLLNPMELTPNFSKNLLGSSFFLKIL